MEILMIIKILCFSRKKTNREAIFVKKQGQIQLKVIVIAIKMPYFANVRLLKRINMLK